MVSRDEAARTYERMAGTLRRHSAQDRRDLDTASASNGERLARSYDRLAEQARQAGER